MRALAFFLAICLAVSPALSQEQALFNPKNAYQRISGGGQTLPVDLSSIYNNKGFANSVNESSFDGHNNAYPAQYMPPSAFQYNGVNFTFPKYNATGKDNAISRGQNISVPPGMYSAVYMLAAAVGGLASGNITAVYADGTTTSGAFLVPAWVDPGGTSGGDIIFPYHLSNKGADYNRSSIFLTVTGLQSTKQLSYLQLPYVRTGASSSPGGDSLDAELHIFSLSLSGPISEQYIGPKLQVQYARSTRLFIRQNTTQIVEATIANVGTTPLVKNHNASVTITSPGQHVVQIATINRLMPGDQVTVQIGVENNEQFRPGDSGPETVIISGNGVPSTEYTFNATYGIAPYEATFESIYEHESPQWYNDAKFGIFIHWGVYSVPAWGNVGPNETYAEWYWWNLNQGPGSRSQTYQYHLQHYGANVVYDDFFQDFTASDWDPQEWVDLFADAGARYFVQVSKHHDGYAIFDVPANVTTRTSVAQSPHRNLLGELFDASKKYQPQMHKATYYSLPEWFYPDYKKYGVDMMPGGNATDPFTYNTLPYTGYVPVNDYLTDLMLPEMNVLADMGTEIMWCDIGGPNVTLEFASKWFNTQAAQGRQVAINGRCGLPGDFDTPEYMIINAIQRRKWESNLGMDPFSYGYNAATPLAAYMNATMLVRNLIDIVSKNGNFLLDVGPLPNGTILQTEQDTLREAGLWIRSHAEAIFNTMYWFVTPQEGPNVRFTTTQDAFYILMMTRPNGTLVLKSPIPLFGGDQVTIVGGDLAGTLVPAQILPDWSIMLTLNESVAEADRYAWVFKITYT